VGVSREKCRGHKGRSQAPGVRLRGLGSQFVRRAVIDSIGIRTYRESGTQSARILSGVRPYVVGFET
jgi:hypothetical protein